ncbi:hypothetical protein [Prauserella cavernicola]|uniref:Uncharacterized protein n=1 Tax=Prauserella cavernicola TaxID=2800127 RepID=A0A934QYJ4_9PSEU|nr:hypothetical protein [Prauserella cavernicola]MBK1788645.1 hypothetical protein [Prauserella cavernicola]
MYRRTLTPSTRVRRVLLAALALCVALTVAVWMTRDDEMLDAVIATVVLLGIPVLMLGVRHRIDVDDRRVVLEVAPVFRKVIPRADIIGVEVLDEVRPLRDFRGYGYRPLGAGEVAFVLEPGPAVRVRTRAGKSFVISDLDRELARLLP